MAVTWRGLHRGLGLATVLIFLGTGLYMRYREPPVAELEMGLRMLFRSRHIYILLTGLLNLLLGLHLSSSSAGWPRWLAAAGSALVALSPLLAVAAFFHDGEKLGSPGPLGFFAIEAAFAGSLLHLLSALAARRASPATGGPSGDRSVSDDRHLHRLYLGRRFHLAAVAASVSGGILMLGIYGGWIGLSLAELPEPLAGVAAANPWLIYPGVGLAIVAWSVAILAWIPEEVVRQGGEVIFRSPLRELVSPAGEPLAVSRALLGWVIISTPDEKSVVLPALYERGEELLEALRARVPKDAAAGEGDRPPR